MLSGSSRYALPLDFGFIWSKLWARGVLRGFPHISHSWGRSLHTFAKRSVSDHSVFIRSCFFLLIFCICFRSLGVVTQGENLSQVFQFGFGRSGRIFENISLAWSIWYLWVRVIALRGGRWFRSGSVLLLCETSWRRDMLGMWHRTREQMWYRSWIRDRFLYLRCVRI